jgi:cysteine synthase
MKLHDEIMLVTNAESIGMAKRLAKEEGIFTGISGGGAAAIGCKVINKQTIKLKFNFNKIDVFIISFSFKICVHLICCLSSIYVSSIYC